jgi:acylphosphatase
MSERMVSSSPKISYQAVYSGRVQGVGFRFTAQRLAHELGLTGWVKNLGNGDVELVAEGDALTCQELAARLEACFQVTGIRRSDGPASGLFSSFEIRY